MAGSGDEAPRLVDGIAAATASMQAMFCTVPDVTKLETGAVTPAFADFELEQVLDRLRASFAGPAAAKERELDIPRTVVLVSTAPVLLETVPRNLLSNAVRYTSQGEISLNCGTRSSIVRTEVVDTGSGVPVSERERIFEEFHRLDNVSSSIGRVFSLTVPNTTTAIATTER